MGPTGRWKLPHVGPTFQWVDGTLGCSWARENIDGGDRSKKRTRVGFIQVGKDRTVIDRFIGRVGRRGSTCRLC
ncbi:hypothetical protein DAI22_03g255100 [Oryza sativa Japonica Group]|nr:hypothetical protein DAI22_03g255100 [Oryza sativa Japonica Group]